MNRFASMASALLALAHAFVPASASACGGFFCDNSQPVNQAAERIIFARTPGGGVTAVIQIQYSGPSERFAWMLPVAGNPDIAVSSNTAFQRLQQATNPSYQLTTVIEGTCREDDRAFFGPSAAGGADGGAAADGGMSPVTVIDAGAVGPYDFVVIAVDPTATDPAADAVGWLRDNGYDVNDFGADRLTPYLESGMNLLAFRLTKGNDAGSIRPVMLSFGNGLPSIPIRPTAVAATDDMGVMVWVLGEHRAVPANYASLELNEALINWLNPNSNYNDVVTRAANEAGGQGFVTEMAGEAAPLADRIFSTADMDQWQALRLRDWTGRHGELLSQVFGRYGQLDGMRDVILRTVPTPSGITDEEFRNCPSCYVNAFSGAGTIEGLDVAAFLDGVETEVMEPMRRTRELFAEIRYATRFYTTMSADEMTMDPVFDFNPDLDDYSNTHTAERVIECSPSVSRFDAPWRVDLDGTVVRGRGSTWPFQTDDPDMPANLRIRRLSNSGPGTIIEDNSSAISSVVRTSNATIPGPPSGGGGCSTVQGATSSGLFGLLFAAALVTLGRRRFANA